MTATPATGTPVTATPLLHPRDEAVDHAVQMVRRYETAVACHPIESQALTTKQEHELANLEHWKRRLQNVRQIDAETQARDLAIERALDVERFVDDYCRYLEDLPALRYPDSPHLSPDEFLNENWGEYEPGRTSIERS